MVLVPTAPEIASQAMIAWQRHLMRFLRSQLILYLALNGPSDSLLISSEPLLILLIWNFPVLYFQLVKVVLDVVQLKVMKRLYHVASAHILHLQSSSRLCGSKLRVASS